MHKPKCIVFFLAVLLLLIGGLYAGPATSTEVEPSTAVQASELMFLPSFLVEAEAVAIAKYKCYCTCTADDGAPSAGQTFEVPAGGNCTSLNGAGCNVGGENGTLSNCRKGPVPVETEPIG